MLRRMMLTCCMLGALPASLAAQRPEATAAASLPTIVIRAGRLIDPDTGTAATNQAILVEAGRVTRIGANISTPAGAETVDLSQYSVLPGLVDAHNHLALTYKKDP